MKFVRCYPDSKLPIGTGWGTHGLTAEEMVEVMSTHPQANWGILLGPVSDVVDIECDSDAATTGYAKRFPDVRTPNWQSTRGKHYLFKYDARLANLPAVVKTADGLEFRLGNGKAAQSICPPSTVDGVKREWILSPKDVELAPLPEAVIQELLALPPAAKQHRKSTEIPAARKSEGGKTEAMV